MQVPKPDQIASTVALEYRSTCIEMELLECPRFITAMFGKLEVARPHRCLGLLVIGAVGVLVENP